MLVKIIIYYKQYKNINKNNNSINNKLIIKIII